MNLLLAEMKRSLAELDLGLKGDLTMSEPMERLMHSLANDTVPLSWRNLAYASLRPLGSWLLNLLARCQQLTEWTADLGLPKVVWLSGLFNPQSFLTAVMQTTARRNDWPLDKTVVLTEVTKKTPDQIDAPSRCGRRLGQGSGRQLQQILAASSVKPLIQCYLKVLPAVLA
jgi:dynein heavy chain